MKRALEVMAIASHVDLVSMSKTATRFPHRCHGQVDESNALIPDTATQEFRRASVRKYTE